MAQRFFYLFLLFSGVCLCACSTSRQLPPNPVKSLNRLWDSLNLDAKYHIGLSVYDLKKKKFIFNYKADNFFTPASNMKLLTMYASLQYLGETIPAAYYQVRGDTMIVWGGGDPGTRYPGIHKESPFINFLRASDKTIVFSDHHFNSQRFGEGWAWDDYPYDYQSEKTAFPIYGNLLHAERWKDSIVLTPSYFNLVFKARKGTKEEITRNEWGSEYTYNYDHRIPVSVSSVPVSLYENDIRFIWKEVTGKDISFRDYPFAKNSLQLDGSNRDSLLKYMMQESDNFMAEQLLLACALAQTGSLNETNIIRETLAGPLAKIPDSISWVDGSGLSRYNLLTPRSIIWVLDKMAEQKGIDYMKAILAAGGRSGTLRDYFKSDDGEPYIYAKSGTLRHTYNLSGILITRSGRVLLLSWMNNQFNTHSSDIKHSMEKLFIYFRNHY